MTKSAVLSIGGFDPTSDAGIIADSITCRNVGVKSINLISALTIQNSKGLSGIEIIHEKIFKNQFEKLQDDFLPKVIKIGMLPAKYQIDLIFDFIQKKDAILVVDPVKSASSGGVLVKDEVYSYLIKKLFPLSYLVTPNIPEGELIVAKKIRDVNDMIKTAKTINDSGAYAVYLKGGHLKEDPVDILSVEGSITKLESKTRIKKNIRGTGCKFASAAASFLLLENDVVRACTKAKDYIQKVLADPEKYYC